jgi:hypothetical protein
MKCNDGRANVEQGVQGAASSIGTLDVVGYFATMFVTITTPEDVVFYMRALALMALKNISISLHGYYFSS